MKSDSEDPGPGGRRAGSAAAEEVVAEHPQSVKHSEEFEDVWQVGLLRLRELAAFISHRMMMTVVVGLGE